jgi:hypothetical protein
VSEPFEDLPEQRPVGEQELRPACIEVDPHSLYREAELEAERAVEDAQRPQAG